jgi:hypothetical protein
VSAAGNGAAQGNLGIPKLSGARVDARVLPDANSGISRFEYRVFNGSPQLRIKNFQIDISSTADLGIVSGDGLSFVNPALRVGTELNLSLLGIGRFEPVGTASDPLGWVGAVDGPAYLGWGVYKETAKGHPGDTVAPFVGTSRGLPGIRRATLVPDVFDLAPNADELPIDSEEVDRAIKAADQQLRTVGPVAPPKELDFVAFAEYIASLRSEAAALGWVRSGANVSNVDSLLDRVRSQLIASNFVLARRNAAAFISAVESASCTELDCPSDRPMTAEARALLALNMAYLLEHIPVVAALETAPVHVWLGLQKKRDLGTQFEFARSSTRTIRS